MVVMLCYIIWIIIPSIEDSSGSTEPFHIPRCALNIWQTYGSGSRREEDVGAGIDSRTPWTVNGKPWERNMALSGVTILFGSNKPLINYL